MKKIISFFLTLAIIFCIIPVSANADETPFVSISIIHKENDTDGIRKNLSVIESGKDLLLSGEDLAALGGFEYRIEKGSAYFTRGMKTLRVDLSTSRLYPFEDITLVGKIDFAEKVQEINGVYYFPGTEMLPWLNVTCFLKDGILNIQADDVSIWEIIPQFVPDEFAFDFTACCKELGVNGKYLKARAYLQDEGLSGMFFDLIPVVGDYLDYYDLYEDALQDQSASEKEVEDFLDDATDAEYWMEIADDFEVIDDLPDELRVFGEASKILANNAVSFAFELGTYVKYFYIHDKNVLSALFSMELNADLYGLPDNATTPLVSIREHYEDYYAGIGHKMMVAIGETSLDGLTDTATGLYKAAVTLLGFAEATSPDWAEGINRISSYDVIAEFCVSGYEELTDQTSMSSVQNLRGFAYMYLYSCEQNWTAMANYAAKEGKLDLKAKYEANADSAEEWQRTFMRATPAEQNDSHEYGDATGGMKQEYVNKLKDMFSTLDRTVKSAKRLSAIHEYSDDGGIIYSFIYDDSGLIKEILESHYGEYYMDSEIDPIQVVNSYYYDKSGRLTLIEGYNGDASTEYSYNDRGLLEKNVFSFMVSAEISYAYDEHDRLVLEEHSAGIEFDRVEYVYNEGDELVQVSVSNEYDQKDVYITGGERTEDSRAVYYYNVMTEQKDERFTPFVISEVQETASIIDAAGNPVFSLYLSDPVYTTDENGNLARITCDYQTYDLYYTDITVDNMGTEDLEYSDDFAKLEYAMLIGALRDAGLSEIRWELSDSKFDETQEMLLEASGDNWYNYPLLADFDHRVIWFYTPSGPASSAGWAFVDSSGEYALNDTYGSAGYHGSKYFTWSGGSWEMLIGYEQRFSEYDAEGNPVFSEKYEWLNSEISFDEYEQKLSDLNISYATLSSPSLSEIAINGKPSKIMAELERYLSDTGRPWVKNKPNSTKYIYLIPAAANIWESMPYSIADELELSNFDCALTVVTAETTNNGVVLTLSRTYNY